MLRFSGINDLFAGSQFPRNLLDCAPSLNLLQRRNDWRSAPPRARLNSSPGPFAQTVFPSKYPPAKPEAFWLLTPQRDLISTGEKQSNCNGTRFARQWASARRRQQREVYSRNSQSLAASPAEPGELAIGLDESYEQAMPSSVYQQNMWTRQIPGYPFQSHLLQFHTVLSKRFWLNESFEYANKEIFHPHDIEHHPDIGSGECGDAY